MLQCHKNENWRRVRINICFVDAEKISFLLRRYCSVLTCLLIRHKQAVFLQVGVAAHAQSMVRAQAFTLL
jgi:hypothetical protein